MRLAQLLLVALVFTCVSAHHIPQIPDNARELYEEFKLKYGKHYVDDDDEKRFAIFKDNLLRAQSFQMQDRGTARYGITQFSDLTTEEFAARYSNARITMPSERLEYKAGEHNLPKSFDWRDHGAVSPVENQNHCGSCWAFSVIGNIEGQWFLKKGELLVLSKQQLVDCDEKDHGCDGGYPPKTYKEIIRLGGIELQSDYPYVGRDDQCKMDRSKFVAYINSSVVLEKDENAQASWLVENGPMSVALNSAGLQFYQGGICHPKHCYRQGLNHAVLTVGYGEEDGIPYWIVKNSYGLGFGENGYFRIYRGDGTCGINLLSSSVLIK